MYIPELPDPRFVLRHGADVLRPLLKVAVVAQPWWKAVRSVRTDLAGTNLWDILNRTKLEISEIQSGLETGALTVIIVDPVEVFIASGFRLFLGGLRRLVALLSAFAALAWGVIVVLLAPLFPGLVSHRRPSNAPCLCPLELPAP